MAETRSRTAHNINERHRTADVLVRDNIDFAGLLLTDAVQRGLASAGFEKPSPIQLKAIPLGRCGLDLIVQAKSGTGKTCVFSVIALESLQLDSNSTQVLILAPTREIAVQIQDVLLSIGSAVSKLRCHVFIGGLPIAQDKVKLQKCHIAVGTPGRIKQLIEEDLINTNTVRLFVLDEADKLLDENFKEQINWIYSALPENKQMLALSATYPEYLAQQLTSYMRDPVFVRLNPKDLALQGLVQYCKVVPFHSLPHRQFEIKIQHLLKLLSQVTFNQCLIFSNYQTRAQNLSDYLCSKGWPSTYIAGSQDQSQRLQAMEMLKKFQCRILISTDLTARGIDAERVNLVVNLDVPYDAKTYLHRIGRAGRFGTQGIAVTYTAQGFEYKQLQRIRKECHISMKLLPDAITCDLINQDNDLDDLPQEEEEEGVSETAKQNGFCDGQQIHTTKESSQKPLKVDSSKEEVSSETVSSASNTECVTISAMHGQSTDTDRKHIKFTFDNCSKINLMETSNATGKSGRVARQHDKTEKLVLRKSIMVERSEISCQTEAPLDHADMYLGAIKPLGGNQNRNLVINYQNAVQDLEDFLKTQDTDHNSWRRFYKEENEEPSVCESGQGLNIETTEQCLNFREKTGHDGAEAEQVLTANVENLTHLRLDDNNCANLDDNSGTVLVQTVQSDGTESEEIKSLPSHTISLDDESQQNHNAKLFEKCNSTEQTGNVVGQQERMPMRHDLECCSVAKERRVTIENYDDVSDGGSDQSTENCVNKDEDDDEDDDDDDDEEDEEDDDDEEDEEEDCKEEGHGFDASASDPNYYSQSEEYNAQAHYQYPPYYNSPVNYAYQGPYPSNTEYWNDNMYSEQITPGTPSYHDQSGHEQTNQPTVQHPEFDQPQSYGMANMGYGWGPAQNFQNSTDQMSDQYNPYSYQAWIQAYQAQCYYNQCVPPSWHYGYW